VRIVAYLDWHESQICGLLPQYLHHTNVFRPYITTASIPPVASGLSRYIRDKGIGKTMFFFVSKFYFALFLSNETKSGVVRDHGSKRNICSICDNMQRVINHTSNISRSRSSSELDRKTTKLDKEFER